MEFSFKINSFFRLLIDEPMMIILWSLFGVPAIFLIMSAVIVVLNKMKKLDPMQPIIFIPTVTLLFCWLLGFAIHMILFFMEVSPIKMVVIWVVMFFIYAVFITFNHKSIRRFLESLSKKTAKR